MEESKEMAAFRAMQDTYSESKSSSVDDPTTFQRMKEVCAILRTFTLFSVVLEIRG